MENSNRRVGIMDLPNEVFTHILSFLSYDDISRVRGVCTRFNTEAQGILNQGYYKAENFHAACVKKVKDLLPRRESERRKHPLWVNCDILSTTESQLSLLGMTFMRRSDITCCFIPGKVLDEIFRILRLMYNATTPIQNNESLLQELRDISSMAMEHFDEKIFPTRSHNRERERSKTPEVPCLDHSHLRPVLGEKVAKLKGNYDTLKQKCDMLLLDKREYKRKILELRRKIQDVRKKIKEQNAMILEHGSKIASQKEKIGELSKKLAEYDNSSETVIHIKEQHCQPKKSKGRPKGRRVQKKTKYFETPRRSERLLKRYSTSRLESSEPKRKKK